MELLTIGAFAKASRLSPKALRLYDELGLLTPARVDPVTGYRHYAPQQLERARLVAWLRRLGMPLARIRHVCTLDAAGAAQEVRAFRARFEAETAARRTLAAFLVDQLTGKDPTMSPTTNTGSLEIRCAALSDTGRVRGNNQDTAYAGSRLLAVADGFGGAGAAASAAAVDVFRRLETGGVPAGDLLGVLEDAVERAERAVRGVTGTSAGSPPDATKAPDVPKLLGAPCEADAPDEAGTTLTALFWTGSRPALVHIGDSRAHLLRGGELFRITQDHTVVQAMLDEGRIGPEEVASHPQRSLLIRALGRGADGTPDLRLHEARVGDRYLLCIDCLSAVVGTEETRRALSTYDEPEQAVRELVSLANRSGGPDNISCVVADVVKPHR